MKFIFLCLTWLVFFTTANPYSVYDEQESSAEAEIPWNSAEDTTEVYEQATFSNIKQNMIDVEESKAMEENVNAMKCESELAANIKLQKQMDAYRVKFSSDVGKFKKMRDLISSYETQIDASIAEIAAQKDLIDNLNTTINVYRGKNLDLDVKVTDMQYSANADAAKLRQRDDQLMKCKTELNKSMAGSCLPFGNSSDIQMLHVPGIKPFFAPCEYRFEGSGWTIIQRRLNGSVNFNRNWQEYRDGFGDLNNEFFIGLEKIHRMTLIQPQELLIVIEDIYYKIRSERFSYFYVGNEAEDYPLLLDDNNHLPTYFKNSVTEKFTTYDRDNDNSWIRNCAKKDGGGWWLNTCANDEQLRNLNGGFSAVAKAIVMMIRPLPIFINDDDQK